MRGCVLNLVQHFKRPVPSRDVRIFCQKKDKFLNYLLDTCVLSEYVKKNPNYQVIDWLDNQDETSLFISILSIA